MKTNRILNYLLFTLLLPISFYGNGQKEFTEFLKQAELPACYKNLESKDIEELMEYGKTSYNGFQLSAHYDETREVFELSTIKNCHDTKKLQLKYVERGLKDYVFIFQELMEGEQSYGNIKLYECKDSTWTGGREIAVSWTQLFNLDEEELEELRELDQYPKCMVNFEKDGMKIEIPWKLYTYGENSQSNGYVKAGGKQPVILKYDPFI